MAILVTAQQMIKLTDIKEAIQRIDPLLLIPKNLLPELSEDAIEDFYEVVYDIGGLLREIHELNPDPGCQRREEND